MSESLSLTSGVAGRYAIALFTLCEEEGELQSLEKDVKKIFDLLDKSEDFVSLIESPIYKRDKKEHAISAVGKKIKLSINTINLLSIVARKGRSFIIPNLMKNLTALLQNGREEVGVDVISADKLSNAQKMELEKTINKFIKKKVNMHIRVDASLIGGLIVKLGSKMIDTSIKSKLVKLQTIMKEGN